MNMKPIDHETTRTEILGETLGYATALFIFATILFHIGGGFGLLQYGITYFEFIYVIMGIYLSVILLRGIKNDKK